MTPGEPIPISRPVTNTDQKSIKVLKQKDIGSNLPSIIENVENRVREYDNKRWVLVPRPHTLSLASLVLTPLFLGA